MLLSLRDREDDRDDRQNCLFIHHTESAESDPACERGYREFVLVRLFPFQTAGGKMAVNINVAELIFINMVPGAFG